jgi:formiminotetrahydrofolate cyclodeaminase
MGKPRQTQIRVDTAKAIRKAEKLITKSYAMQKGICSQCEKRGKCIQSTANATAMRPQYAICALREHCESTARALREHCESTIKAIPKQCDAEEEKKKKKERIQSPPEGSTTVVLEVITMAGDEGK